MSEFQTRHYGLAVRLIGQTPSPDSESWIPSLSLRDRMIIARMRDDELSRGFRQAMTELYDELSRVAAWENEGGAYV